MFLKKLPLLLLLLAISFTLKAQKTQWASTVIDKSSEVSEKQYSASQVLGKPNVMPAGGESPSAWTPSRASRKEYIKVGFAEPMQIRQVAIAESYNPGTITAIYAYDATGNEYKLIELPKRKTQASSLVRNIFFELTTYQVAAIKLETDGKRVDGFSSIDAIGISDSYLPVEASVNQAPNLITNLLIENLGPNVNSEFRENGPLLSQDGTKLYFSRSSSDENMGGVNDPEDIYVAELDTVTGQWKPAQNVGAPLNTVFPNFVSSLKSQNGETLLILGNTYIDNKRVLTGVSVSTKGKDGKWSEPRKMVIEDDYNYSPKVDYYMSDDQNTMLMSVERDDSYGDRDLYVSFQRRGGTWTEPMNLGSVINSADEESAPFLMSDNKTMYFSSKGLSGYGNDDIYVTTRLDDSWTRWSEPENLGPEINSPRSDRYFNIPSTGEYAYFTRDIDSLGNVDIFRVGMPIFGKPVQMIVLAGTVTDAETTQPPIGTSVKFAGTGEGADEGITLSDNSTGEFEIVIPAGDIYELSVERDGYLAAVEKVDLTNATEGGNFRRNIILTPVKKENYHCL